MARSPLFSNLFRTFARSPGACATSVLTLGTGVGAVVAMFSIYAAVVLDPVAVPAPEELVAIQTVNAKVDNVPTSLSWIRFDNSLRHARSFTAIAAYDADSASVTGDGTPAEELPALRVSSAFFQVLQIEPLYGRVFTRDDDQIHGPAVCVLSYELWQRRFGGQQMVGRLIELDGRGVEVIGVLPPGFPVPWSDRQIFLPRLFDTSTMMPENIRNGASYLSVIGRLRPGVTLEQAQAELDGLAGEYASAFAGRMDAANSTKAVPLIEIVVGDNQQILLVLLAAVAAVLAVSCANASTLFLGRLLARQRETAVRQALGASRPNIVRQFLVESLGLSLLAGVVGVAVASGLLRAVTVLFGTSFPQGTVFAMDGSVFAVAVTVVGVTAVLVGLVPALYVTRPQMSPLVTFTRGESSATGRRLRAVLVLSEVALSCALAIGATLLVASLLRLQGASPGFDTVHTAAGLVNLAPTRYATPERQAAFAVDVVDRVQRSAGVRGAAAVFGLPLGATFAAHQYVVAGQPIPPPSERARAGIRLVTEDYFSVMQIPIRAGRVFTAGDRLGAPNVCIINESLARRLFTGNPIGQSILRGRDADLRYEVIGVVADLRSYGLREPVRDEVFYPLRQVPWPQFAIVARSDGDPAALRRVMERAVADVDVAQPLAQFATMDQRLDQTWGSERALASITLAFAASALFMALVGLYAVLGQNVASRHAEIGVRVALGANRGRVVGLILKSGMSIVVGGVLIGVLAAGIGADSLAARLYAVDPRDPWIFAGVAAAFAVIGGAACLLPSWRAAKLDPIAALRGG